MISLVTLILLAVIPALIYVFLVWNFDFWRKRGVRNPKPIPFLGTFPNFLSQKQHFAYDVNDIYKQFKSTDNFVGVFMMRTPQLMLLDPAMVHEVYVTAFKHFQDNDFSRMFKPDMKKDPLLSYNPFILTGQEWKEQRALVTPGMTGVRIKNAYSIMKNVCLNLREYIEKESKMSQDGINARDLALRFTSENVADCVLGIKAQSFSDKRLPISEKVQIFSEKNTSLALYMLLVGLIPKIVNLYQIKLFPKKAEEFFLDLMTRAFKIRKQSQVDRQDFLNYILSLQDKKNLNDAELASHTMTFLIDGLDTSASVIAHCLLLLGREPEVQDKLYEEIIENSDESGQLEFEKLTEMPYLDACTHEAIRIFPPGLWSAKLCTEPYQFTNKNGQTLKLERGETVLLPLYSLHHDPEYYPDPEKYQPERFLLENGGLKKYRDMGVFLGFGDGPRQCFGMRFALVQTKAAISTIIRNFKVKVNPKTKPGNNLDPKVFLAIKDGGIWLDFEKRN